MSERLKRLIFRSNHMGSNENDILFGSFADACLADLSVQQLDLYESLLAENDADLFDWATGKLPPRTDVDNDVMGMIRDFVAQGRAVKGKSEK